MIRRYVRVKRVSDRKARENAIYQREMPIWLQSHRTCEIGPRILAAGHHVQCRKVATHVHHVAGRIGKLLNDQSKWLASCDGECHPYWIHQKCPGIARHLGLLV